MFKRFLILAFFAALTTIVGCVKDSNSGCVSGIELCFEYVLNNEGVDLFGEEVEKISVYVFDGDGIYSDVYTESGAPLAAPGYTMPLPLDRGRYTLLAWGGTLANHMIGKIEDGQDIFSAGLQKGVTRLEDFRIELDKATSGRAAPWPDYPVAANVPDLYYGMAEVEVRTGKTMTEKISLTKNTSRIQLKIIELPGSSDPLPSDVSQIPYEAYGFGNNTMLNYENKIAPQAPTLTYIPSGFDVQTGPVYNIFLTAPRLVTGNPVTLRLWAEQEGRFIMNENLVSIILKSDEYNTQDDIDREDLFLIEVVVDRRAGLDVMVKINGWEIGTIDPILPD